MEIKVFQKTQRDLAAIINLIIDTYWEDEIDESKMIELIQKLYAANTNKFKKEGIYTTILRQQCGKRRLEVVDQVIHQDIVRG
ncbi:TIGR04540 family protein [Cytobacillus kochii]|uniref:TIGR04540 family protein n=1 Tax=Cytobacillus kochii TaxID=859143 RepID=UPI001CD209D8|nr:TIGR04540 family protein [Cytobacillus kochii]MCA1026598.1 TIGR04540 family protein [Cytobacillus kochii]